MEDKLLIIQLKDPNSRERGFQLLVDRYKERLYWHIRRLVYTHENADDVLQNTFLKVYKNIERFEQRSSLYSWMYRIATNESMNFLNSKAAKVEMTSSELSIQLVDNLENDPYFDGDALQISFQKAILALPEKQRLVFQMRYYEEMSYQEISEVLQTSVGGLKASYHHARKKIEAHIRSSVDG